VGVSYLVYASIVGDSLSTSICTFTSQGQGAAICGIRDGRPVDSLFGTVGLMPPLMQRLSLTNMRPLAEVSVRVIDSEGRVQAVNIRSR
jgi:hypothetical protein